MTGPRFQFTDERPAVQLHKGYYYRAWDGGRRLYFSEREIGSIIPMAQGYKLVTVGGGVYHVRSSIPDYVENEAADRESVPGNYFFRRVS